MSYSTLLISLLLVVGSLAEAATPVSAQIAPNPEPAATVYAARRAKLMSRLPQGALVVLNASPAETSNLRDYRPSSNFWYLTGLAETDASAVLLHAVDANKAYTLFVKPKKWETDQWTGYRTGLDGAKKLYAADDAYATEELIKKYPELMRNATSLWYFDGGDTKFRETLLAAWNRRANNSAESLPVYNLDPSIAELRLIKDASEVALLRHAVDLSVKAHLAALPLAMTGKGEWNMRAAMVATCLDGAAARMAYPPIVGAGRNSVVLHYQESSAQLQAGAMIVNDTACEYGMYAADVTRSYPVGGVFSSEQRAIYEIVLKAAQAGQAKAILGAKLHEVNDVTIEVVVDGLMSLGILKGSRADIMSKQSYKAFYPHGSSHWIGLDVHDAGNYEAAPPSKDQPTAGRKSLVKLKPGMAFTIEPGIYIPENADGIDKKWWNIGVRIEDDYLVTAKGVDCLSCALPRDIASLEKLIQGR